MTYTERVRAGQRGVDRSNYRVGKKPKARCPVCGRMAPVNKGRAERAERAPQAGTLGWHAPALGRGRIECAGTGQEPVI